MTKLSKACLYMSLYTPAFLIFFVIASAPECTCSPWIHSEINGYRGLVIAVHPSVPERKQFVDKLQDLVVSASSALYRATSAKFFFSEVIIVLPSTWTRQFSHLPDIEDIFSQADFRVYGNGGPAKPYSVQYNGCETQGRYVQLTSQFVQSHDTSSGELLMQEFARYRYGIFDDINATEGNIPLALTTQGFRCDGQDVMDTLDNHPDFTLYREMISSDDGSNNNPQIKPIPDFKLFKTKPTETCMLIFDVSRTLWENSETASSVANLTLERLVKDFLPEGSQVGFLTFSDKVYFMRGLTQLSPDIRQHFFRGLGVEVKGTKQALANALNTSLEILKENHLGSKIIVVSDGNNDVAPPLENVIPTLVKNMISVSVISPTTRHKNNLKALATATGGNVYFLSSDWTTSIKTQTSMLEHISKVSNSGSIQVYNGEINILHAIMHRLTVHIDNFLGEKTKFEFEGEHLNENGINIFLASYSGVVYNLKNATHYGKMITFLTNDETGNWTVLFANPAGRSGSVHLLVTSRPRRADLKLNLLESWIDVQRDVYYSTVKIFADVHQGPNAIIDANVTAIVRRPNGDESVVALVDMGIGADLIRGDGIYSAFFTNFNGDGIYTVLTYARCKEETRSYSRERRTGIFHYDDSKGAKEDYFTRVKYAGTFTIEDYQSSMNKIPPGQVTDLTVGQEDISSYLIISWTAPGSDFDTGTVALYDLRMGFKLDEEGEINDEFKTWHSITASSIMQGTLNPSPSGTKETISISFPDINEINDRKIYFALRSQDENGNPSKTSNIAMFEMKVELLHQKATTGGSTVSKTKAAVRVLEEPHSGSTTPEEIKENLVPTLESDSEPFQETLTTEQLSSTHISLLVFSHGNVSEASSTFKTLPIESEAQTSSHDNTLVTVSTIELLPVVPINTHDENSSTEEPDKQVDQTVSHFFMPQNSTIGITTSTSEATKGPVSKATVNLQEKTTSNVDLLQNVTRGNLSSHAQNETEFELNEHRVSFNTSREGMMAPDMSMVKDTSEIKMQTSSVVAAWVGGFVLIFFIMAGIAMVVRSVTKRGKYDVSKLEADATNGTTQELIADESTATVEDSF